MLRRAFLRATILTPLTGWLTPQKHRARYQAAYPRTY